MGLTNGFPVRAQDLLNAVVRLQPQQVITIAQPSINIEWPPSKDYVGYFIKLRNVNVVTAADDLWCRLKINGAYPTTVYKYNTERTASTTAAGTYVSIVSASASAIVIADAMTGAADAGVNLTMDLQSNIDPTLSQMVTYTGVEGGSGTGSFKKCNGAGFRTQGICTGVQFLASTGNLAVGSTFELYGIRA